MPNFLLMIHHIFSCSRRKHCEKVKWLKSKAFQWNIGFNHDPSKKAQDIIFSRKFKRPTHPLLVFKNNVSQTFSQKHLSVILGFKLTFEDHLNNVLATVNKAVGLFRKLRNLLPGATLITICKAFIRPHLDCGGALYDQAVNNNFKEKLESMQHNECLALTGAIRGMPEKKSIKNCDASVKNFPFF